MTEVDLEYTVRDAIPDDRRFVVETTARVRQPHEMNWRDWCVYGDLWARRCVDSGRTNVVEAKGVILGFIVVCDGRVECLYVKQSFRGLGLGQLLLDAAGMDQPIPCRAPTDSFRIWASRRGLRFTVIW